MKTAFIIVLFVIGLSFFSKRTIFEKKFGAMSLSGLELYLLGMFFYLFLIESVFSYIER